MQFRRPNTPAASINIAPMVDVVFLLVIFFAVSTTFLETSGLKLELPSSSSTAQRDSAQLAVLMSEDGTLSFDGEIVDRVELARRLKAALSTEEQKLVILRADRSASHGDVVALIDLIREAGAVDLTLAARKD